MMDQVVSVHTAAVPNAGSGACFGWDDRRGLAVSPDFVFLRYFRLKKVADLLGA
jgi:hypothetical protein